MSLFSGGPKAVRRALAAADARAQMVRLPGWAKTIEEKAAALGTPIGAIVQSLVFLVGDQPALALLAGDRQIKADALPRTLNLAGEARPADAAETKRATGFAPGGVSPVGLRQTLPIAIDVNLKRFATLYVPAGDARHVFATTMEELKAFTAGIVSYAIAEGEAFRPERRMQRPFDSADGLL